MQKTLIIALIVAVVALSGVVVYQKLTPSESTPIIVNQPAVNQPAVNQPATNQPIVSAKINDEIAKQLVIEKWGDCSGSKCKDFSVNVNYNADIPYVSATYDGMGDDSIKTEIFSASLTYSSEKNKWIIDETTIEWGQICWPGRGHQTLSKDDCI